MTKNAALKRLPILEAAHKRHRSAIGKIETERSQIAKILCPFKADDIIVDPQGNKFIFHYAMPKESGFGGSSFKPPGYSMMGRKLKRDGKPRRDRERLSSNVEFTLFDPASVPPKPVQKHGPTRQALEAALARLPKKFAEKLRQDFKIK